MARPSPCTSIAATDSYQFAEGRTNAPSEVVGMLMPRVLDCKLNFVLPEEEPFYAWGSLPSPPEDPRLEQTGVQELWRESVSLTCEVNKTVVSSVNLTALLSRFTKIWFSLGSIPTIVLGVCGATE